MSGLKQMVIYVSSDLYERIRLKSFLELKSMSRIIKEILEKEIPEKKYIIKET